MKKIIVCFLLICIIGLCCFTLSSCDDENVNNDVNNSTTSKIEFVKNEYGTYIDTSYNEYTFRMWYPYQWFVDGYERFGISFALSPDEEFVGIPRVFVDYLIDNYSGSQSLIKPDSWAYFKIQLKTEPKNIYFKVCYFDEVLLQTQIDLTGTYKTA